MLYDPTNDVQSLLEVAPFKSWLDRQPPEKTYNYGECWSCAIAQYVASRLGYGPDGESVIVSTDAVKVNGKWFDMPAVMNRIVIRGDHTFGAAAKRAEEVLQAK